MRAGGLIAIERNDMMVIMCCVAFVPLGARRCIRPNPRPFSYSPIPKTPPPQIGNHDRPRQSRFAASPVARSDAKL
jgi:hypothetical protein